MHTIVKILGVAIFVGVVGVTYQLTGLIAMEREMGLSQLIDCMMPNASRWQPQAARLIAAHLALDIVYGPAWILTGVTLKYALFFKTSVGITIGIQLLAGLALSSFSIFGAAFFKKAQLSGITAVIVCLILGIVAQLAHITSNVAVIVLSILFPPMNYVFFVVSIAKWEAQDLPTNLLNAAPYNPYTVPGILLWVFLIIQIFVYPLLGAIVERVLHGTTTKNRSMVRRGSSTALTIDKLTKRYRPNWFSRYIAPFFGSKPQNVLAVDDLSLDVFKGQIMVLLGANGSGKSTTLDAVSGLTDISSGDILVNYGEDGGTFGLCPQKNVLWDTLTTREHITIFNRLKAVGKTDSNEEITGLINYCDLTKKATARAKTLSGGQRRKLQLAIMFTGGTSVCCVDEVSSGLDPISRRKIWDILLAERGARTIILTTHFLDEAELLADHIALLSRGALKAQGSSVELKHQLGSGYRIYVSGSPNSSDGYDSNFEGLPKDSHFDDKVYTVKNSAEAARFVNTLEQNGITDYRVSGPTIEDVFMKVAEEIKADLPGPQADDGKGLFVKEQSTNSITESQGTTDTLATSRTPQLLTGTRIGMARQAWVLFLKRATILRRNTLPYLAALLIPIIAAGLVTLFLQSITPTDCSGDRTHSNPPAQSLAVVPGLQLVMGPSSKTTPAVRHRLATALLAGRNGDPKAVIALERGFQVVDTLQDFHNYFQQNHSSVTPGGFYLGDSTSSPVVAWEGNYAGAGYSSMTQNALNILLTNLTIGFQYRVFEIPHQPGVGDILQLTSYFCLAMAVFPSLFALYTTVEKLRNVRALHYSNGVRSLPLWLAYLGFDFCIVLIVSVIAIVILRAVSNIWYYPEYLFVIFFLYGLASTLLSYIVSHFSKSQLATFAFAAGGQCVVYLIYLIAYMVALTFSPVSKTDYYVKVAHFVVAVFGPIGNLARAMILTLNVFSSLCHGTEMASYPGAMTVYGGPITYLAIQSIFLLGLLVWLDSGPTLSLLKRKTKPEDAEGKQQDDDGSSFNELSRVTSANDGLRVLHLTKNFGKSLAVENVTFGVCKGEVYALLGPNGAGKTTVISLIRGDMQPSWNGGDIFVDNTSVLKQRATARSHLGVCPQFDAMDQMTVREHLRFYAQVRGVPDVEHNVREVMRAVGLTEFQDRMGMKLSGGNKRKLSLGIALMGNPSVLLLDEPSSGMDAAAKRVMWRTLGSVVPGRSIVLTTHSMEEADALANRAGIMARRMLAQGDTEHLRRKYGNRYQVHLIHSQAPHTSDEDMERLRTWVQTTFLGAEIEQKTYHGQLRFSVPATASAGLLTDELAEQEMLLELEQETAASSSSSAVGRGSSPLDVARQRHRSGSSSSAMGRGSSPFDLAQQRHRSGSSTLVSKRTSMASRLFSNLEHDKTALGVQFYSVGQTTLDQVFLTIVAQHDVEEENSG